MRRLSGGGRSKEGGRKDAAAAAVCQWRGGGMLLHWRRASIKLVFGSWLLLFLRLGSLDDFIADELRMAAVY